MTGGDLEAARTRFAQANAVRQEREAELLKVGGCWMAIASGLEKVERDLTGPDREPSISLTIARFPELADALGQLGTVRAELDRFADGALPILRGDLAGALASEAEALREVLRLEAMARLTAGFPEIDPTHSGLGSYLLKLEKRFRAALDALSEVTPLATTKVIIQ